MPERPAARPRPPVSSAHSELVSQKPDADEAKPLVEPLPDLEFLKRKYRAVNLEIAPRLQQ